MGWQAEPDLCEQLSEPFGLLDMGDGDLEDLPGGPGDRGVLPKVAIAISRC